MTFVPKPLRDIERGQVEFLPPSRLVAAQVKLTMMDPAERDGELIAHLAAQRARLCETKMVRVGGTSSTHEARLRGDESPMVFVPLAPHFAKGEIGALGTWDGRV